MSQLSQAESDREDQVLKLASAGLSTRNIARAIGDISQSTVVRILRKADTGPQATIEEKIASSQRRQLAVKVACALFMIIFLVTFVVLTAAVATMAWR